MHVYCIYVRVAIYYHNVEHWPEMCFCVVSAVLFCECFVVLQVLCCVFGTLWCCTGRKCCCHCECCVLLFCGCYVPVSVAVCGVALDASVVTTLPTNIGLSSSNSFPSSSFGSVQACHLHKKLKSKIFSQLCGLDPSTYLLHTTTQGDESWYYHVKHV